MSPTDSNTSKGPRQNRFLSASEPFNPYAPPKTSCEPTVSTLAPDCYRRGKLLIARNGTDLPPRCVKCNAPVSAPARMREFVSHPAIIYLLFPLYPLVYLIAALFLPKIAVVNPALCYPHAFKRALCIATSGAAFCGGMALAVIGTVRSEANSLNAIVLFFISAIICLHGARLLVPVRVDGEWLHLKGCGQAFLNSLPVAPETIR
jgi:hypothetical protein